MERTTRIAFLLTWAATAVYALMHLDQGWFPADAGTIGQAAERVMAGELPHRDFADVYTGGLAMLHALGFRILGVSVLTPRWITWGLYVAWIPALWALIRRLGGTGFAVLGTLLAAVWSLPVYPEAMPSWYNLFLATFGALALLRFSETRSPGWVVVAGVAGGLSILVKIVGLYFLAAAGLFLLHDEATRARPSAEPEADAGFRALTLVGCLAVGAAVLWLVLRGMGLRHLFLYGVPPLVAMVPTVRAVSRATGRRSGERLRELSIRTGTLAAGAAIPVALFLVPYLMTGALGALVEGVFVRPGERLDSVRMIGPAGQWWFATPAVLLILWHAVADRGGRATDRLGMALGVALWTVVIATSGDDVSYLVSFRALTWLSPLIVCVAAWRMVRRGEAAPAGTLALILYGFMCLIQVPFAAPAYFFYAAPLGVLVALAVAEGGSIALRARVAVTLGALVLLSALRFNEGVILDLGYRYRQSPLTERLVIPRAMGLRVSTEDKEDYERLFQIVSRMDGTALYAGPDSPEVYFLTARTNPTTTLYDLLDDVEDRDRQVLRAIDRAQVPGVVIRPRPLFSPPLTPDLLAELERRYPIGVQVGRFIVARRPDR